MAALTLDTIVDRVRSICVGAPFGFGEAESWDTFDLQPTTNLDGVFRIPPPASQGIRAVGFGYSEDRTDTLQVWVARKRNGNPDVQRRTLLRDMHSLTAAIVRDAFEDNGDYSVGIEGRGHAIVALPNREFDQLRLTLPVTYETQL